MVPLYCYYWDFGGKIPDDLMEAVWALVSYCVIKWFKKTRYLFSSNSNLVSKIDRFSHTVINRSAKCRMFCLLKIASRI